MLVFLLPSTITVICSTVLDLCTILVIGPVYAAKPSQPMLCYSSDIQVHECLFPDVYNLLMWSNCVSPFPSASHCSMHISVWCRFHSCFFLTPQHSVPYVMTGFYCRLVHFVFQLCWYVPVVVLHHPMQLCPPPLWPGKFYLVVFFFLRTSIDHRYFHYINSSVFF